MAEAGAAPPSAAACAEGREVRDLRSEESWSDHRGCVCVRGCVRESEVVCVCVCARERREVRGHGSEVEWRERVRAGESARVLVRERERIEVRGPRSEEEERVCLGVSLSV